MELTLLQLMEILRTNGQFRRNILLYYLRRTLLLFFLLRAHPPQLRLHFGKNFADGIGLVLSD